MLSDRKDPPGFDFRMVITWDEVQMNIKTFGTSLVSVGRAYGSRNLAKTIQIYKEAGSTAVIWRAVSYFYRNGIRPILPDRSPVLWAGIIVDTRKIGDSLLSKFVYLEQLDDAPDYEQATVTALKANVRRGETVVVVGGGRGITATIAAIEAGRQGHVNCFEGDLGSVKAVLRTGVLNGVRNRLKVDHAIVGKDVDVWGSSKSKEVISAKNLPACDVLELDCEGAELDLLRDMIISPRVIIVETHGHLGSSTNEVHSILKHLGYNVIDLGWAEPGVQDFCIEKDIKVLVGTR
jgi:hypothetical protein